MHQPIHGVRFRVPATLVAEFASASLDVSPLHVDPAYAHKTPFGRPVAHGVLALLVALSHGPARAGRCLRRLRASFRYPVFPDTEYEVAAEENGDHLHLRVLDGTRTVIEITAEHAGADLAQAPTGGRPSSVTEADTPPIEEMADAGPLGQEYQPDWARLDDLVRELSLHAVGVDVEHVAALSWASYLAGMRVPGRAALISAIAATFGGDPNGEGFTAEGAVVDVDNRYRRVRLAGRLSTGTRGAEVDVMTFVRREHRPPDTARIRRLLADPPGSLTGKVALVTGGSRGLGAVLTQALAVAGCQVYAAFARSGDEAREMAAAMGADAHRVRLVEGDVADAGWCERLAGTIAAEHGGLDLLLLNAGPPVQEHPNDPAFGPRSAAYTAEAIAVSQTPLSAFAAALAERAGWLVAISSAYVHRPPRGLDHYVTAKHALEAMVRTAASRHPDIRTLIARPPRLATTFADSALGAEQPLDPELVAVALVRRIGSGAPGFVEEFPVPTPEGDTRTDAGTLAVAATFAVDPLIPLLERWTEDLALDLSVRAAPYAQVFQQLLDPGSVFATNGKGVNVALLRLSDWPPGDQPVDDFVAAARTYLDRAVAPLVVVLCPSNDDAGQGGRADRLGAGLRDLGVLVVGSADWAGGYDVPTPFDPAREQLAHIPYTAEGFHALAVTVMRRVHAALVPPFKALVLDCDNTLWRGVCAETGPDGVTVPAGHRALQEWAVRLHDDGVLICLASKNAAEDVDAVFRRHPGMPLRPEHVAARRITWNPKSTSLTELADELSIGVDSMVLLDDNPMETAEVAAAHPGVLALTLPADDQQIPGFLRRVWAFDRTSVTDADRLRNDSYRAERRRRDLADTTLTFQDFLAGLDLRVDVHEARPEELDRVAQLTQRTNQFNLSGVRRTEAEIRRWLGEGNQCWVAHAVDRFGDYGLVGVAMSRTEAGRVELDTFLLSCRAMGKGVEHTLLSGVADRWPPDAQLSAILVPTSRNTPARRFFDAVLGAGTVDSDDRIVYRAAVATAAAARFTPQEAPRPVDADTAAPAGVTPAAPVDLRRLAALARIAVEYHDIAAVSRHVDRTVALPSTAATPADALNAVIQAVAVAGAQAPDTLDAATTVESLSLSSLQIVDATVALEATFGRLPRTLFFEHRTLGGIAAQLPGARPGPSVAPARPVAPAHPAAGPAPSAPPAVEPGDGIAVVGVAGRYPGASDVRQLWRHLLHGHDLVGDVSVRWGDYDVVAPDGGRDKTYTAAGGVLDGIDEFDPLFFGISPAEAETMDPQQRLLLQVAYHALEDAGHPDDLGRDTGVYVGAMSSDFAVANAAAALSGTARYPNADLYQLANRISHFLDLTGPSLVVDTACSASGVALQLAFDALRAGRVRAAIVGAVNLILHPARRIQYAQQGMLSRRGRCQPFSAAADGMVTSEGVAALVLRPLRDALADGDHVYGVIRAVGTNTDGRTNGFMVPSPAAQADLIAATWRAAGIDPRSLGYIEAHGTGTPLGDPIEVRGLTEGLRLRGAAGHLPIGSIKSNIGHLEAAAALAGVTKVLLQLDQRTLVPSLHADELNPHIEFAGTPLSVQRRREPWSASHGPRRAAVSSFGAGGVNVHLVIDEAPAAADAEAADGPEPVPLSARSVEQLQQVCRRLAEHLRTEGAGCSLADVAYTLRAGRQPFECRAAVVARDREHLLDVLDRLGTGEWPAEVMRGQADRRSPVAAVFDGSPELTEALGKLARARRWDKLGRLWVDGATLDWSWLLPRGSRRRVPLPGYPFAAVRLPLPVAPRPAAEARTAVAVERTVLYRPVWESEPSPATAVDGDVVALVDPGASDVRAMPSLPDVASLERWLTGASSLVVVDRRTPLGDQSDDAERLLRTAMDLARLATRTRRVTYLVVTPDDAVTPAAATVVGFGRALAHENPFFRAVRVTTSEDMTLSPDALVAEASASTDEVRWTGALRSVRRWLPAPDAAPPAWRPGGTYVITGGSGGAARIIAGYLMRHHRSRVVLVGRAEAPAALTALGDAAAEHGGEVLFLRADVTDEEELASALRAARQRFGRLHGVVHAAGVTADRAFTGQDEATMRRVTAPKITGAVLLDRLTADDELDFFVLMSSVVSLFGNAGQSGYAAANAYLDGFAAWRAARVREGARRGTSLSVLWPSWANGGMVMPEATRRLFRTTLGLTPMDDASAIGALEQALGGGPGAVLVGHGDQATIRRALDLRVAPGGSPPPRRIRESLVTTVRSELRTEVARLVKLDATAVDVTAEFGDYGFNSMLFTDFTNRLNERFGLTLTPVVFFTHRTLDTLAAALVEQHDAALAAALAVEPATHGEPTSPGSPAPPTSPPSTTAARPITVTAEQSLAREEPIAVVGMAGRFPGAADLDEYWRLLMTGACVTGAPPPGRESSPGWPGGYLDAITRFDASFFGISPREARLMDPQQRLLLETAWQAVEHAGYDPRRLAGTATGVFAAATLHDYSELLKDAGEETAGHTITGHVHSIIANRVSYLLDLTGPSETIDTACSSSLTALHRAVNAIRHGECSSAIVGGVNVLLTADWFASLDLTGVLSPTGRCWAFDARADGFVRSEGVAAVLIKPLARALEDGDTVHGVILGTAVNHGGRGHSLTAPRPDGQAAVVAAALRQAGVSPRDVTFIETHGTGTKLGDPVELAGLREAFAQLGAQDSRPWCHLGAVKGTVGHLESAAGMASLLKVLLAFRHGVLPPNASGQVPNPHLGLGDGPFQLLDRAMPWAADDPGLGRTPRHAGISSFGFGGANAHTVLREPPVAPEPEPDTGQDHVVVLSARTDAQLRRYARRLRRSLDDEPLAIADVAYTSRVGRTPLPCRLALVATSCQQLADLLDRHLAGRRHPAVHVGDGPEPAPGDTAQVTAHRWARGLDISWPTEPLRRRVPLATYPFDHSTAHGLPADVPAPVGPAPTRRSPTTPADVPAPVSPAPTGGRPATDVTPRLLVKQWTPAPAGAAAEPGEPPTCLLILSSDACLPALDALAAHPHTTWLVMRPVSTLPNLTSSDYETDFGAHDAGRGATEKIIAEHGPLTHVVDLADATSTTPLPEAARVGVLQAVARHARSTPVHFVHVTRGVSALGDTEPAVAGARLAALVRAVGAEYRNMHTVTLDVDLPSDDVSGQLDLALAEVGSPISAEVAHRGGVRHVPRLATPSSRPEHGDGHLGDVPVRADATYLITGGTGGLGLATAELLAARGARRLALAGLRPAPERETWDALGPDDPWYHRVAAVRRLEEAGAAVTLHHGDLTDTAAVRNLVGALSPVAGVIHAAGVTGPTPAFVHKSFAEIERCWTPKGAALDVLLGAVGPQHLDFFVCYSSLSAVVTDLAAGLSDYASANAYLDAAMARAQARATRAGRATKYLSINWGSWAGLGMGEVTNDRYRRSGFAALTRDQGLALLDIAMATVGHTSVVAATRAKPSLADPPADIGDDAVPPPPENAADQSDLHARCVRHLRGVLARHLLLDESRIAADMTFADLGVDSILIAAIVPDLEVLAGAPLEPSLVLEHPSVDRLAAYLLDHHRAGVTRWAAPPAGAAATAAAPAAGHRRGTGDPLAVIGMAGRYPAAENLDAFWDLLRSGRSGVTEVPRSRWDVATLYSPALRDGMSVSKWGGFLTGIEEFDPDHFGIRAEYADHMDPLVRLLLECAAQTFADAGYRPTELAGRRVGVFAGAATSSYPHRITVPHRGTATGLNQNFIAAQLAQTYDLRGPNLVVDTACSSSLSAVYLARQALLTGECEMALVGGADLILDERPYLTLSAAQALSPDGVCHVFDADANGLVPGEGVGAVLLRRLDDALAAGDRVLAVIEAAAMNNDGRTMGLTTPNPDAQRDVVADALAKAGVGAETLSYIEAHGTGTMIGDPIELRALTRVFQRFTTERGFCAIGSVKSNLGHLLMAAGMASLHKVMLSLRHRALPPTLHCRRPNPRFAFDESPFYPNLRLREWPARHGVRRAGVSAFGFGGTNCHVVVREPLSDETPRGGSVREALPAPVFHRRRFWVDGPALAPVPARSPLLELEDLR
ncbi:SDR family NAD(P)-dependent oxidoreductase [Micromonospora sp. WMMD718]|nr:SDR family NAD(P)-dependent oxidoreductase [Micromonospora sp. WMMD718]MDG4752673.1 SDR family NAD(P)-dependent oxidoreductase [Micromonospora sp. WMMD718]